MYQIIRIDEVKRRCSLSRSSIYAMVAKGLFPSSISIGARAVGWVESDINEWIAARTYTSKTKYSSAASSIRKS